MHWSSNDTHTVMLWLYAVLHLGIFRYEVPHIQVKKNSLLDVQSPLKEIAHFTFCVIKYFATKKSKLLSLYNDTSATQQTFAL